MSGIFSDSVVPFKGVEPLGLGSGVALTRIALKTYRVTAFYEYPPVERSAVVEAEGPQRAMVRVLLEGRVPALFRKDEFGWLLPVYWHPRLAGDQRWPALMGRNVIAWGDKANKGELIFGVDEIED